MRHDARHAHATAAVANTAANADLNAATRVLTLEADGIRALAEGLDGTLSAALDILSGVGGRVVVTGMGIVSCLGNTLEEVSDSLHAAKPGIKFSEKYKEIGMMPR